MANIQGKTISELQTIPVINGNEFVPLADPTDTKTYKASIDLFKGKIFENPVFTGAPIAPTPGIGDDSQRVATTAFVQDTLAGVGLNPATATTFGTVRTNVTDTVPVVYLKSEVDDRLNAIRPVNLGGTGATNAATARTNLSAAARGNNADIVSLDSLVVVPGVVNDAISSGRNLPVGTVLMWLADSLPSDRWLMAHGQILNVVDYPNLFALLGSRFGGNGINNFALPNMRGCFPMGAGASRITGQNRNLGAVEGAESVILTQAQMPFHEHGGVTGNAGFHVHIATTDSQGNHAHAYNRPVTRQANISGTGIVATSDDADNDTTGVAGLHSHNISVGGSGEHAHSVFVYGAGGSQPHSVLNPLFAINFIVKVR